jgi:alpha-D-ribose 1-methylphosphonate 5-triphosphate diphosphatase
VNNLACVNLSNRILSLENATVITLNEMIPNTTLGIENGKIAYIGKRRGFINAVAIDVSGLMILPGFIDLHSDAIETEIQPRPGGRFPIKIALVELDKKLASCGITTMYHCLTFGDSDTNEIRRTETTLDIIRDLNRLGSSLRIRNRIHARFEITDVHCAAVVEALIREQAVQMFSIMDHTPGQGQFTSMEHFKTYYGRAEKLNDDEITELARKRKQARADLCDHYIRKLTSLCRQYKIPMASHDDDTQEKVRWVYDMGIRLSEFPVKLAAARCAAGLGMYVMMGAPNVVRGSSLTDNLSGRNAIQQGYCNIIGSDYSPAMMLHAIFTLHRLQMGPLNELVKMVSYNPAKAIGIDERLGSIQEGLWADLVLVDPSDSIPRVVKTFVSGKQVFSAF